ncbi:MAG: hypothetical protein R2737_11900 [Candidatus Nanopelagicales bacterium]
MSRPAPRDSGLAPGPVWCACSTPVDSGHGLVAYLVPVADRHTFWCSEAQLWEQQQAERLAHVLDKEP